MSDFVFDKFQVVFLPRDVQNFDIFSVDVEDWFHSFNYLEPIRFEEWDNLPSVVEKGFNTYLELLLSYNQNATFFFLGWVAKKYPHLVRKAKESGFEIASHGMYHQAVNELTPSQFFEDVDSTKKLLEDIAGDEVWGYRSPSFTFLGNHSFFYESLIKAGYRYDSSLFPAKRKVGGSSCSLFAPFEIFSNSGKLLEFPITAGKIFSFPICFSGGGYFRLFPYFIFKIFVRQVKKENRPIIIYVHPRDIYPHRSEHKMNTIGRFKTYVNIKSVPKKIEILLKLFRFHSFKHYMLQNFCNILFPSKIWNGRE
ncbi:MAG: polysaccharide deacetylase family protein [Ignavibacteria bacterium]|nr:polysaccharide deacetylase family protein [Ignavibacteria bacterium]